MKLKLFALLFAAATAISVQAINISDAILYTQKFDTLATDGTVNTTLPAGWGLTETGGGARDNEAYAFNDGGSSTGDTYSYGTTGSGERALGGLRSGTLIPSFGVQFNNSAPLSIVSLAIDYTGEQWRLGALSRPVPDRLDFEYSVDATSLTTGTWTAVNDLDFAAPTTVAATTGALNGNAAANRTAISGTISGLTIASGETFWLRWLDFDASSADDGLAIDDFSLTASFQGTSPVPETLSFGFTACFLFGFLAFSHHKISARQRSRVKPR